MRKSPLLLLACFLVFATAASAFPIAAPGTEGLKVIVSQPGNVRATYRGNSATYSNDLYFGLSVSDANTFVFNNHSTPVGTTRDLGFFEAGTELVFRIHVRNTGRDFYTGPADRNPDNHTHARVQANWQPNETLVSFEDLYGGAFNYNDLSFSFTNTDTCALVCNAGGPYLGHAGSPIQFDASQSYFFPAGCGTIVDYAWDFGDGSTGTGVNPMHTYALDGDYQVTLCVTDDRGNVSCCSPIGMVTPEDKSSWGTLKARFR